MVSAEVATMSVQNWPMTTPTTLVGIWQRGPEHCLFCQDGCPLLHTLLLTLLSNSLRRFCFTGRLCRPKHSWYNNLVDYIARKDSGQLRQSQVLLAVDCCLVVDISKRALNDGSAIPRE
jgi:hypothetical protein